jgi:CheY-like chemotaxis protein
MQARIVVVHKETAFRNATSKALQAEGYQVDAYKDPTRAASALHAPGKFEILIAEARTPRRTRYQSKGHRSAGRPRGRESHAGLPARSGSRAENPGGGAGPIGQVTNKPIRPTPNRRVPM